MISGDAAELLRNCSSVAEVKTIHAQICEHNLHDGSAKKRRRFLENLVVQMYAQCGSVTDARQAFDTMSSRKNVFSWTIIISAYVRADHGSDALQLFRTMNQEGDRADEVTLTTLLGACSSLEDLQQGKMIHSLVKELGYGEQDGEEQDLMVGNSLVNMYAKCRSLADAIAIFDRMKNRSVFSWTIMVTAFAQNGQLQRAIQCYRQMCCDGVDPNAVTFVALLAACSSGGELAAGRKIAARVEASGLDSDLIVGSAIVNFYGKCGRLDEAREAFDRMPAKNNVTWNGMIAAYVQSGAATQAMDLFATMEDEGVVPDAMAVSSILGACSRLESGKRIHSAVIDRRQELQSDRAVCNALVHMYARCGSLDDARLVFLAIPSKNTVSWTTIIAAFAQQENRDYIEAAFQLFREMDLDGVAPTEVTIFYALETCSKMDRGGLASGRALHTAMDTAGRVELLSSVEVLNSLLDMYASCGSLIDAEAIFDRLLGSSSKNVDVVSWTNMIAAYVQHGQSSSALLLAKKMDLEGVKPDEIAMSTILGACTAHQATSLGRELHRRARELGYASNTIVGNALVFMYGSWGRVDDAARVFQELKNANSPDSNTFTAMIAGYARQGRTLQALSLYNEMNLHGVEPRDATFTSIFQACSHAGFLAKALEHFVFIYDFQGLEPTAEHFGCVVDLLGRSGFVREAEELVLAMPFEPDIVAWRSLLASCGGSDQGASRRAAEEAVHLQPSGCSSHYVLLSNLVRTLNHHHEKNAYL
ncbi:pentatricopeptide repeat-containing protein At3g09040, mitochondrial-like [Selaginella moellendorffii]|uniref:pentatricopeptide repeat-containing protein At3g09040, mitochondrial-like n=1 Tax=Selaginella moellendorffii TaxID=88036 RepID=UPI000D1CFA45|nr:pentatricopeptide repeat-containing protein At3g09040, mitochondrial-like [Selaginella moellendorffii]|eukprot:XP_024515154.1 pentatricopeptide repeat-containing protein At3g09040, mitochondrial-like [Selaginella moellendorffii]